MRTLATGDEDLEFRAAIQLALSPFNREIRPLDESRFTNLYTQRYHLPRFSKSLRTAHVLHLPGRLLTGFDVKLRLFRYLRTLFRSWHSFGSSFPLFSSAYGLFLQNAGGGGGLVSVRDRI